MSVLAVPVCECVTRALSQTGFVVTVDEGQVAISIHGADAPRLIEGALIGRGAAEALNVTSRICGLCPVAHQIASARALEKLGDRPVDKPAVSLRRLLALGEWIESHTVHIYLQVAPEKLGCGDAGEMVRRFPAVAQRAMRLRRAGGEIVRVLGGRQVHPVNVSVGGFYRMPSLEEIRALEPLLSEGSVAAEETIHWLASFTEPELDRAREWAGLRGEGDYPVAGERICTTAGTEFGLEEFAEFYDRRRETRDGCGVGPVARMSLNFGLLPSEIRRVAEAVGFKPACRNPYQSTLVRAIEVLYACEEGRRLVRAAGTAVASPPVRLRAGLAAAAVEAPRGVLFHRYEVDGRGALRGARLITPTMQNEPLLESDLFLLAENKVKAPAAEVVRACERLIRCYDPCVSGVR